MTRFAKDYSTKGMSVEQAVRLILGPKGTSVTLVVIPGGARAAEK
ncbi:MAG: hypothetical protein ACK4RK_21575 [Gemmataceae bacterium]